MGRRGARMMGAPPGPATSNACSGDVGGAWTRCDALIASGGMAPDNNIEFSVCHQRHKQNTHTAHIIDRDHIVMSVVVCYPVFVCLSVCLLATSRKHY